MAKLQSLDPNGNDRLSLCNRGVANTIVPLRPVFLHGGFEMSIGTSASADLLDRAEGADPRAAIMVAP